MKVSEYFKYSWFSDLAYVHWNDENTDTTSNIIAAANAKPANGAPRIPGKTSSGDTTIDTLGERIFQSADVGSGSLKGLGWKLLHFQPNDAVGFAASLFGDGKEKVLAVRGTETEGEQVDLDLFKADLQELGGLGMAISQFISLYNYIQQLRTPQGQRPILLQLHEGKHLPSDTKHIGFVETSDHRYFWTSAAPSATEGAGLLLPNEKITLTGHSLGGHLAALAMRVFPDLFDRAVTFNAPGYDPYVGLEEGVGRIKLALNLVPLALAASNPTAATEALDRILTTSDRLTDAFLAGLISYHTAKPIRRFDDLASQNRILSLVAESEAPGDDIDVVSNSLITGEPASPRIPVTTEVDSHSMSQLVDTLGVQSLLEALLPGIGLARAGQLIQAASLVGDDSLERLVDALGDLLLHDQAPRVEVSVSQGWWAIIDPPSPYSARSTLHARLLALQSFVENNPGTRLHSLVNMAAPDLADLALQPGAQGLPYRYALQQGIPFAITGRDDAATAALYAPHNADHRLDLFDPVGRTGLTDTYLQDRARMLVQLILANRADSPAAEGGIYRNEFYEDIGQGIQIASDREIAVSGHPRPASAVQYVFGDDTANTLLGGNRDDHLHGGAGNDVLEGRQGDDYLAGGIGADTYLIDPNSGGDVIFDRDGQGSILFDGDALTGGKQIAANLWQSANGNHHYVLDGDTLYIDERLRVEHFRDGDLGINLSDSVAPRPAGVRIEGTADNEPLSWWRELGLPPRTIYESPIHMLGAGGNDLLSTASGDDWLQGGIGNDWLLADVGDDQLEGGPGDDNLFSGQGRDTVLAGTGNDLVIDSQYRIFQTSGDATWDARIWRDLLGDFEHRISPAFYTGADGEITAGYAMQVPQAPIRGLSDGLTFEYQPNDPDHGIIIYHDGSGASSRFDISHDIYYTHDSEPNRFFGGDGIDFLRGNDGPDLLSGGEDKDWLLGGAGNDILLGGTGADKAMGQQDDDLLDGGEGDDELYGGSGQDTLRGGAGDDTLVGDNRLAGEGESDTLFGGAGSDLLYGNGGDDQLDGGSGHDTLWGEEGNDLLQGSAGDDTLHGGAGDDRLFGGSGQRDWLFGDAGEDWLNGGQGQDQLDGGPGEDRLDGGPGNDRLFGGKGDDVFVFRATDGTDLVEDGEDGDEVLLPDLRPEDIKLDLMFAIDGTPLLVLAVDQANALFVKNGLIDGPGEYVFGDDTRLDRRELFTRLLDQPLEYTLRDPGNLHGGRADDTLAGSLGADVLTGGEGNDTLAGSGGNDRLEGGPGMDTYLVGPGTGSDTIIETPEGTNRLRLLPGASIAELDLVRVDDDLRIELPGHAGDEVVIRDFFAGHGVWSLEDQDGGSRVLRPDTNSIQLRPTLVPAGDEALRDQFVSRIKATYGDSLRLKGYTQQADGQWRGEERTNTHHTVTDVRFQVTRETSDGDYLRSLPLSDRVLVANRQVLEPTPSYQFSSGGIRVSGGNPKATYIDLGALGSSGLSGVAISGNAIPIPGAGTHYNPLTGQTSPSIRGYAVYPAGTGSLTTSTVNRLYEKLEYQETIHILELRLGAGDDSFSMAPGHRGPPFNLVDGGAGNDRLDVRPAELIPGLRNEPWSFAPPADLVALPGSLLLGGAGDDRLFGGYGGDTLSGGSGNDYLRGGAGNDLYRLDALQGEDVIFEDGRFGSDADVLALPSGITRDQLRLSWGTTLEDAQSTRDNWYTRLRSLHTTLRIDWGTQGGVTLILPHSEQQAGLGIDRVVFGDGSETTLAHLIDAHGGMPDQDPQAEDNIIAGRKMLYGAAGDDHLIAQGSGDPIRFGHWQYFRASFDAVLIGGEGRDRLEGGSGDDLLIGSEITFESLPDYIDLAASFWDQGNSYRGGAGDDQIWFTAGSDSLRFGVGDGNDRVRDLVHSSPYQWQLELGVPPITDPATLTPDRAELLSNSHDKLIFEAGIRPDDIQVRRVDDDLYFEHRNGNDSVSFEHWFDTGRNQLDRVEFSDGYFWDRTDLDALLRGDPANQAPVAKGALGQLPGAVAGSPLQIALPDHFTDPEGMPLSYSVEQANSQDLPDWLSFDTATRTLRGTPPSDARGILDLMLIARDDRGKTGTAAFRLDIAALPGGAVSNPAPAGPPIGQPAPSNPPPANPAGGGPASGVPASGSAPAGNAPAPGPAPANDGPPKSDLPAPAFAQSHPRPDSAIDPASLAEGAARARRQPLASRLAKLARQGFFVGSHSADGRAALTSAESPVADGASGLLAGQDVAARWQRLQQALEALNDQWQDPGDRNRGAALGAAVPHASPLPTSASPALATSANAPIGLSNASLSRFQGLPEGFRAQTL